MANEIEMEQNLKSLLLRNCSFKKNKELNQISICLNLIGKLYLKR